MKPGVDWMRCIGLLVCLSVTYAVAVYCRLAVIDIHAAHSTLDVTTADAYGWLTAVSGLGVSKDHLLAQVGRLLVDGGILSLETLALYGPVFTAALAAPLLVYWGWTKADPAAGIFAGILGLQLPVVYARTGFGYFDSDPIIVPLLVAVILAFEAWAVFVEQRTRSPAAGWIPVFAATVVMGAVLYVAGRVHVLFVFNAVVLTLIAVWLHPRTRIPCLFVLAIALLGPYGLVIAGLLQGLSLAYPRRCRILESCAAGHPFAGMGALAATVALIVAVAEAAGWIEMLARFRVYVYGPVVGLFSDAETTVGVRELARLDATSMFQLLTGNVYLSVLGIAAVAAALRMNRSLLFFLFPLLMGLSAPVTGQRFALFGALVMVLGAAVVLSKLAENLVEKPYPKFALLGFLGSLYSYQLFQIYAAEPPAAYGNREVKKTLAAFREKTDFRGCNLMLTSWGQGYLASFYTGLPAILDGSSYPAEALRHYGAMMVARREAEWKQRLCKLVETQRLFIDHQIERFQCGGSVDHDTKLYWLVTWDNVLEANRWFGYAGENPEPAKARMIAGAVPEAATRGGVMKTTDSSYELASTSVITDNGVRTRKHTLGAAWHLVENRSSRSGVLVHEDLHEAYFLKAFLARIPERGNAGSMETELTNASAVILSAPLYDLCPVATDLGGYHRPLTLSSQPYATSAVRSSL